MKNKNYICSLHVGTVISRS